MRKKNYEENDLMFTAKDLVKAKNVDLLVHAYNKEAKKVNSDGFINKNSKEVKALKDKYEALIARLDTDKNVDKKSNHYYYKVPIDSKQIIGIKGLKPNMRIRSRSVKV